MNDIVCETEERLRAEIDRLEEIARSICDKPGSFDCWGGITCAISELRGAIRTAYKMGGAS